MSEDRNKGVCDVNLKKRETFQEIVSYIEMLSYSSEQVVMASVKFSPLVLFLFSRFLLKGNNRGVKHLAGHVQYQSHKHNHVITPKTFPWNPSTGTITQVKPVSLDLCVT